MKGKLEIVDLVDREDLRTPTARLYSRIFAEPPWGEKCSISKVLDTMRGQFSRPSPVAIAALVRDILVGFSWGYEILQSDLQENARYAPELRFLFDLGRVFYFQELGVKKELRGQGIGTTLAMAVVEKTKQVGTKSVVLSTNCQAIPAIKVFSKLGFQNSGIVRPPKELGRTYWILYL